MKGNCMRRILIVDDKEENVYYLQTLLQAHGYIAEPARHGAEALVKARQAGLHPSGTVIKPFKERQLLDTLETIIDWSEGGKA